MELRGRFLAVIGILLFFTLVGFLGWRFLGQDAFNLVSKKPQVGLIREGFLKDDPTLFTHDDWRDAVMREDRYANDIPFGVFATLVNSQGKKDRVFQGSVLNVDTDKGVVSIKKFDLSQDLLLPENQEITLVDVQGNESVASLNQVNIGDYLIAVQENVADASSDWNKRFDRVIAVVPGYFLHN